jgi:catechol 2,3-dioxygenase-like lactoylglutathione lyase family enzyme
MIVGLDHVQLAMPPDGEQAARDFYAGVLGMKEVPKPPQLLVNGGVWFVSGSVMVHLGIEEPFMPAHKAHPAMLVADLREVERALVAAGLPFQRDDRVPERLRAYTTDPFGNRIELIAKGDGFSERPAP